MWARVSGVGLLAAIFLALIGAGTSSLALLSSLQGLGSQALPSRDADGPSLMLARSERPALSVSAPLAGSPSATDPEVSHAQQGDQALAAAGSPSGEVEPEPYYVPGNLITLKPTAPLEVSANGRIQFSAILVNQGDTALSLTGELIVIKGDGTTATLLPSYGVKLKAGQKIQLPVEFAVKSWHFPPGRTEFLVILRDLEGEIIDRASVTFQISVALQE
ncbi:MAG: hypothetical protein NUW06_07460 [Candidatus Acetothermia bacterium]|jgi:hypothetical protein|nr:hypothetical protein [Candidatus Acetothermia bacterium]MDH7505896.1 hypothetical protein [Candidatus Acetothermia bacterium]